MHPYLCDGIRAFPVGIGLAVLTGTVTFVWLARRDGVSLWRAMIFQILIAASGLFGAKLHSLIERDSLHLLAWNWIFSDGFRSPGAIIALLLSVPVLGRLILPRVPLARIGDFVAVSIPLALVPMRVGCFLYGCCFGVVSHVAWALRFPPFSPAANFHQSQRLIEYGAPSLPVHPLQLYFLANALLTAVCLLWYRKRQRFDGELIILFLALHESGKFLLEFLRTPDIYQQGRFIQSTSLALCVAGLAALATVQIRRRSALRTARETTVMMRGGIDSSP